MINLNNETDYKSLNSTNKFYIFFLTIAVFLFFIIFIKLLLIYTDSEVNKKLDFSFKKLNPLPTLFDSKGNILAYSDYNYSIFINKDKYAYKNRDASIEDIKRTLFQGDPIYQFEKILTRKHPYHEVLSNFLGQVNVDHKGISLIEKEIQLFKDNLKLSIDIEVQQKIFSSLQADTLKLDPDYSLNVLINLEKEEIMSNVYINNRTKNFDQSLMPLKDLTYEFGSVFKPFTVYSALNNKKLDLNEYFSVDEPVYIGKKEIKDFSPSKIPLQAKDILKESSNRGAILIRRKLDCQKEYQVDLANLGLLKPVELGVGLISRSPIVNNFRGSYCDNIPFGYGLSVSPIQLLNAYGKIITGRDEFQAKILMQDTIKKNIFNLSSNQINKMLFYANDFNNELYQNFLVAGKTGTADKIIDNITVQNVAYISYFPYNDPKYLSLTFMQNPKKTYGPYMTAGNTVKPTFFNILKNIYMNLDLSILSEEVTDI